MGVFGEHAPATLRELRTAGQRTPDELVDRYRLACRPVRDLLVDYLRERQPALDYTSLEALADYLGGLFWADIERHHPGIDSLHLPTGRRRRVEATAAHRVQDRPDPRRRQRPDRVPRINYRECLTPVRAFYLDLAHWAVEDPARWGPLGRALPGRGRGNQPAQGQASPQVPHGRPDPGTAARAADPGPPPSTSAARTPPRCWRPPVMPHPARQSPPPGRP